MVTASIEKQSYIIENNTRQFVVQVLAKQIDVFGVYCF
jgi:hypothetical protein